MLTIKCTFPLEKGRKRISCQARVRTHDQKSETIKESGTPSALPTEPPERSQMSTPTESG